MSEGVGGTSDDAWIRSLLLAAPGDGATQAQILLPGGLSRLGTQTVPLKRSSGIPQKSREAESRAPLCQGLIHCKWQELDSHHKRWVRSTIQFLLLSYLLAFSLCRVFFFLFQSSKTSLHSFLQDPAMFVDCSP
jgi:hypothetical protein